MDVQVCPSCKAPIAPSYFFCPQCGKQVREKALSTGFGKQLGVYFISFFFPPFGLRSAFKYLRQPGAAKIIGVIAIVLTGLSIGLATYQFMEIYAMMSPLLNSAGTMSQLSGY